MQTSFSFRVEGDNFSHQNTCFFVVKEIILDACLQSQKKLEEKLISIEAILLSLLSANSEMLKMVGELLLFFIFARLLINFEIVAVE